MVSATVHAHATAHRMTTATWSSTTALLTYAALCTKSSPRFASRRHPARARSPSPFPSVERRWTEHMVLIVPPSSPMSIAWPLTSAVIWNLVWSDSGRIQATDEWQTSASAYGFTVVSRLCQAQGWAPVSLRPDSLCTVKCVCGRHSRRTQLTCQFLSLTYRSRCNLQNCTSSCTCHVKLKVLGSYFIQS